MTKIAIIGTAGRDKAKPMSLELWKYMVIDARRRIPQGSHVVSGGAAWADHLAVNLFLFGWAAEITLHLPTYFEGGMFADMGYKSAGGAANYYHRQFSETIGRDTLAQLGEVLATPDKRFIHVTCELPSPGIGGMFARNAKVAATADEMLAYTFGPGDVPADGGTLDTWNKFQGPKTHISLPILD